MARSWTLAQLRTRAVRLADEVNQSAVDQTLGGEVDDMINAALCEVHDLLVQAGPPDYYAATSDIATVAGTIAYSLPADFRALSAVYGIESSTRVQLRPIRPITDYDRAYYMAPQGVYSVRLQYIPAPPVLALNSDTFDGVAGWEELIVALVARDIKEKLDEDPATLNQKIGELKSRIRSMSQRDRGNARHITDVEAADIWLYPNITHVRAYRLIGGNIELYEPTIPFPY